MRCLFNNIMVNSEISATNSTVNYPANNIKHPFQKRIFKASTASSVITITLDDTYKINCFFMAFYNPRICSVAFKSATGSTLYTKTITSFYPVIAEYFTAVNSVKSIVITATTNETYLQLGSFAAGEYYQMPDFLNNYVTGIDSNNNIVQIESGQSLYDIYAKLRTYSINLRELNIYQANAIQGLFSNLTRPIYIDLLEDNRYYISPGYFNASGIPGLSRDGRRMITSIELKESV